MSGFPKIVVAALLSLVLLSPAVTGYSGESQAHTMFLPLVVWPPPPSLAPFQLAVTLDYDLYVMQGDGSNKRRLTNDPPHEEDLAWSPDGQRIAYTAVSSLSINIGVVTIDGSGQTYLTSGSGTNTGPVWSPDGTKIMFTSTRDGNRELYLMQSDGSGQTRLTTTAADEFCPTWSPDGTRIAFLSDRDDQSYVYLMQADGSEQVRLTTTADAESCPAWSPDNTRIAIVSRREAHTNVLNVLQLDSGVTTHLHTAASTPWGGLIYGVAWSPDSTQITFNRTLREYPLGITRDFVHLIKADGSEAQPRLITTGVWPNWSPDGMWIAYASSPYDSLGNYIGHYLEVIRADGTQRIRLTDENSAFGPRWAPQSLTSP